MSDEELHVPDILTRAEEIQPGLWSGSEHVADHSYPESGHSNLISIEDESFWFGHRSSILIDLLLRYPPYGVVFDIGGGNGYMVRAMRQAGFDAVLVEPGEVGIRNALSRGLDPVLWGTTFELGIVDDSLPSVGLFDVVEHLEDDLGFLTHIHGLMASPSRCYITVPAFRWLWSGNDETAGHFRRYDSKTIEGLVRRAGFDIEYVSYFFSVLTFPLFLLRSFPHKIGFGMGKAGTTESHRLPKGLVGLAVSMALRREQNLIKAGGRVRWGTSVFVVASKSE